jgi:hypothetical protein
MGARDIRARLFPQAIPAASSESPSVASRAVSPSLAPSSASSPVVTFESLCAFFSTWPLREIRKHTEELVTSALERKRELTLQVIKQRRVSRSEASSGGTESSLSQSRRRFSSAGGENEMGETAELKLPEQPAKSDEDDDGERLLSVTVEPDGPHGSDCVAVTVSPASSTAQSQSSSSFSSSSMFSSGSGLSRPPLSLSLPPAALSELLAQMAILHDELSSLNAQQRQMNEEGRRLSDRLLSIDSSRLAVTHGLNEMQAELTANHARHVSTTAARNHNEERLKATLKKFEECAEEGHRLAREIEVCKETLVSMKTEINELNKVKQPHTQTHRHTTTPPSRCSLAFL